MMTTMQIRPGAIMTQSSENMQEDKVREEEGNVPTTCGTGLDDLDPRERPGPTAPQDS